MNRKEKLVTDYYYHTFNRGVEKRFIFTCQSDYQRFLDVTFHYLTTDERYSWKNRSLHQTLNNPVGPTSHEVASCKSSHFKPPVALVAYCLMPNHFHFLLKQLVESGITNYLHRVTTSFTNYFNLKYDRVGPLLQGAFKYKRIESEGQFVYVSKYIQRNPLELLNPQSEPGSALVDYPWSSLSCYVNQTEEPLFKEPILANFSSPQDYRGFVLETTDKHQEEGMRFLHLDDY